VKSSYSQEAVSSTKTTVQAVKAVSAASSADRQTAASVMVLGGGADVADTTTTVAPGSSTVGTASATEAQQAQVSCFCTTLDCMPAYRIR
jgi:hypothetical protein